MQGEKLIVMAYPNVPGKHLRVLSLSCQERRAAGRGRCGGGGLLRGPGGFGRGRAPGGVLAEGRCRAGRGLLGPVAGMLASSDRSGASPEELLPARAVVLHIRGRLPREPIRGFPRDSGTLTRTPIFSRRAPMCRTTPSAHGRISPVSSVEAFPHDSADPPPAGPGRMCNTARAAPGAAHPDPTAPHPRCRASGPRPPQCAVIDRKSVV